MKDTIDALEFLKQQHDEVLGLFEQIEQADQEEKLELFTELADKIAAHSTIEEKLFYPSAMNEDTEDLLLESTEEHLAAKRVLADLLSLDPDDEHWDAKLVVLKEEIRHHAKDEEEQKLFPILKRVMDEEQRAALGNEMIAMFEELMESEPRTQVPNETTEAAPLEISF